MSVKNRFIPQPPPLICIMIPGNAAGVGRHSEKIRQMMFASSVPSPLQRYLCSSLL